MVDKVRLVLSAVFLAMLILGSSASLCLASTGWVKTYGGTSGEMLNQIIQTNDGGYALAGYTDSSGANKAWLVKVDSSGYEQWNKTFDGKDGVAISLFQTDDGGYVLGAINDSYVTLIKTDSSGELQWSRSYGQKDSAGVIIQTRDGGFAVEGTTGPNMMNPWSPAVSGSEDYGWTVKTDSSGAPQWNQTYREDSVNIATTKIVQTGDGGYVVLGSTFFSDSSYGWLTKLDSSGKTQWKQTYAALGTASSFTDFVGTSDGGFALLGSTDKFYSSTQETCVVKTDSSGNVQWSKAFPRSTGATYDIPAAMTQTSDGGYLVTGQMDTTVSETSNSCFLLKISASGDLQWSKTAADFQGENNVHVGVLNGAIQTSDGSYAITGGSFSSSEQMNGLLLKTDTNGVVPEIPSNVALTSLVLLATAVTLTCRHVFRNKQACPQTARSG